MSAYIVTSSTLATIVGAWAGLGRDGAPPWLIPVTPLLAGALGLRPGADMDRRLQSCGVGSSFSLSPGNPDHWKIAADHLYEVNEASVCHRYQHHGEVPRGAPAGLSVPLRYVKAYAVPEVFAVLGALRCYAYQSCERDDWQATPARAWCESLTETLVAGLSRGHWGIAADPECDQPTGVRSIFAL
jgi:hypothetical protein